MVREKQVVSQRVDTLQHLRAVAALSVVLYHASFYTNLFTGDLSFLSVFGAFGRFGVLVFFALSGHLMAVQAARMAKRPMLFMVHRLVRIYPIFWLVCLVRIAVAYALGAGQFDPLVLMLSPVGERAYPLGVEWTLVYEVAFYMLVCAVIAARLERWIALIGVAWLTAIFGHAWLHGSYSPPFMTSLPAIPMSAFCGAFAAGLVLPSLLARGWVGPAALPVGALLVAVAGLPRFEAFSALIGGVGCAALVGWAASRERGGDRSPLMGRLGDWSYAIYLVHVPVVVTAGVLSAGISGSRLWAGMVGLVLAAAPLFGIVDTALHSRLRRVADRWGWHAQASVLAAFAVGFTACMALSVVQSRREAKPFAPVARGDGPVVETLERAGWHQDGRLAGGLESVARAGGFTYVSGWVIDPQDSLNRTSMLLLVGDTPTVAMPRSYRFDVIRAFGITRSMMPTAFRRAVPDASCPPGTSVRSVAVSRRDKVYNTLNTLNCPD